MVCIKCGRETSRPGPGNKCPRCGGSILGQAALEQAASILFRPEDVDHLPADVEVAMRNPHQVFGRKFVLVRLVGRGGSAEVWKAWDVSLKKYVALKRIPSHDPDAVLRMQREAKNAARLHHAHIVPIHDSGAIDVGGAKWTYISMAFIDGQPLGKVEMPLARKLKVIRDIADALHYGHQQGIVHRDVKPGNILVDRNGRGWLSDFGLARQVSDPRLTVTEAIIGTPYYMAPEQARGISAEIDARSDIYSLGATLYEALTDIPPFGGETPYEIINNVIQQEIVRPRAVNPEVDAQLEAICLKALEKEKEKRYATASEFARDLDRYLRGGQARLQMKMYGLGWAFKERRMGLVVALLFITVILSGVVAWQAINRPPPVVVQGPPRPPAEPQNVERVALVRAIRLIDEFDHLAYGPERDSKFGQGLIKEAVDLLESLNDLKNHQILFHLGRAYHRMGDLPEALRWLSAAARGRTDGRFFAERAWVRFHMLQLKMVPIHALVEPDPDEINALAKDEGPKMVGDMNAAWEKGYATEHDVEFVKVALDHAAGENLKALEALRELCRLSEPRLRLHLEVHILKGDVGMALGQPEDAIEDFEEVLAIRKNDPRVLYRVIRAYQATLQRQPPAVRRAVDLNKARAYVGKIAIIEPDSRVVDFLQGFTYVLTAEYMVASDRDPQAELDVATDALKRVVENHRFAPAHAALASAYYMEAQMCAKATQDIKPAVDQALYHCNQAFHIDQSLTEVLQLQATIKQFGERQSPR